MTPTLITLEDVLAASERLVGIAHKTPMERSRAISATTGSETLLKCEHLQRTGSFKIRGAYNRVSRLSEKECAQGVVCASAGNHAQGVALSATLAGVQSTVFMPATAPLPKVEATRNYGADVKLIPGTFDDALETAVKWAAEQDAVFVHPYDHRDVIAGQGTAGLEIADQAPELGSVVVPIGGGGLISGVATALKARLPGIKVIGVQAEGAACFPPSLRAGEPRSLAGVRTIADGIAIKRPGDLTLRHVEALVDDVVTVSDESLARAVLLLVERAKQVVEPSGAAGLAAVLERASRGLPPLPAPVCVLLAGGNVDPLLLNRIITAGLNEEGRYHVLRTRIPDEPGALSHLLAIPAEIGANLVSVRHHRVGTRLGVLEVEVELELETRGSDHIDALERTLADGGYTLG